MRRFGIYSLLAVCLLGLTGAGVAAEAPSPEFREVYELLRAHLAGTSEAELDRAAVQGLIAGLSPKVLLATQMSTNAAPGELVLNKSSVFDDIIAYVRVARVGEGLAKSLREACDRLGRTNTLKGVVIDLRYAGGDDYAAAAAAAEVFLKKERPLLDWGSGMVRATDKSDALDFPVAVLVNHQTSCAAEALAAVLRATGAGLVLGNATAGEAMIRQEFLLKSGLRLRIATGPIKLGDGSQLAGAVVPDILVRVSPEEERAYYSDAYRASAARPLAAAGVGSPGQTNTVARLARRLRVNEADLVRERRDGASLEDEPPAVRRTGPEKPVVADPALARALDVLKGLAVVREGRH